MTNQFKFFCQPLDILQFTSLENEQFLVSITNNTEEMQLLARLQGLYQQALTDKTIHENELVIYELLTFTHYHFLFSTACLMRSHLSEAFASVRAGIDGCLVAAQIIHDRPSQIAYTRREKPFDNFARYLGNIIRHKKLLPHHLMPTLIEQQKKISGFAVHADIGTFLHRASVAKDAEKGTGTFDYFQYARDPTERAIHGLTVLHSFVMVVDVFSDFLVKEQKALPQSWQDELHGLGQAVERRYSELQRTLLEDST